MPDEAPRDDGAGAPKNDNQDGREPRPDIWAELIRIIPPSIAAFGTAVAAIIAVRN